MDEFWSVEIQDLCFFLYVIPMCLGSCIYFFQLSYLSRWDILKLSCHEYSCKYLHTTLVIRSETCDILYSRKEKKTHRYFTLFKTNILHLKKCFVTQQEHLQRDDIQLLVYLDDWSAVDLRTIREAAISSGVELVTERHRPQPWMYVLPKPVFDTQIVGILLVKCYGAVFFCY